MAMRKIVISPKENVELFDALSSGASGGSTSANQLTQITRLEEIRDSVSTEVTLAALLASAGLGTNAKETDPDAATTTLISLLRGILEASQSSITGQFDPVSTLVTAADVGDIDNTWKDQGSEIDCQGYKTVGLWINHTINDSSTPKLRVLSKHTNGDLDEYILDDPSFYEKDLTGVKVMLPFDVTAVAYIQVQTKATTVGATSDTATIKVTKVY